MRSAVAESRKQIFGFLSQTTSLAIIPRVITAPVREFIAERIKNRKSDHVKAEFLFYRKLISHSKFQFFVT